MYVFHPNIKIALLVIEIITAFVAIVYFFKLKNSYWKWFSIYLVIIAIQEAFWYYNDSLLTITKQEFYAFFGIPVQYLFLYWLYAYKSLRSKKLFIACSLIYLLTYIPIEFYLQKTEIVKPMNIILGTTVLLILVVLEFIKQIKNDDILKFKENKMFYINIAVILFYVGTYPFWAFYDVLVQDPYIKIWNMYYLYFLITNIIMYLLFIASFIWGKHRS
jgi:hypothetical protein